MEEKILSLFDHKWFNQNIIFPKTPYQQTQQILSPNPPDVLVRSFSDHCLSSTTSDDHLLGSNGTASPDSVLPETAKKLQTIFSGKEFEELEETMRVRKQGREKRGERVKRREKGKGKGKSKSLSELEFEELKGFMDLGFVFSEEDKDSSFLGSIIPGLQRLGNKKQGNNYNYESRVFRPYLSEAWEVLEERKMKEKKTVISWTIPSDLFKNEVEMKNHLRLWAHTVACFAR